MKTQCTNCKRLFDIQDSYKNRTVKCSECKQPFEAIPCPDIVTNKTPPGTKPKSPKPQKEYIDNPGIGHCIWGALLGIGGILAGLISENGIIAFMGLFYLMLSSGIGGLLNRAERIAHHTERMREESKNKKSA